MTKDQTVLTTVSTLDPIYVEFQLSETEYLRYHTAAAGTFRRVEDIPLELLLADGTVYSQPGRFNALDLDVRTTTGTSASGACSRIPRCCAPASMPKCALL